MSDIIAVTGASGQFGRLVIAALKRRVSPDRIVALVRSSDKVVDFGVGKRDFDHRQADTLVPALAGVSTLLLISGDALGRRIGQHREVISAAKAAGVGRIVYASLLHADRSPINLAETHRLIEADLATSGIPTTILRNGWYFENHISAVAAALANGVWIGSAGAGRISHATCADLAEAAATVLTSEGHSGQTYELGGDNAHTLADLAAELSRQTGRDIPYRDVPVTEYAAILEDVGLPSFYANAFAEWDADASRGAFYEDGRQLSALLGRPTQTHAEVIRQALA